MKHDTLSILTYFRRATSFMLAISTTLLFINSCASKSGTEYTNISSPSSENIIIAYPASNTFTVSQTPVKPPEIKREFHANPYVSPTSDPQLAKQEKKWGIQVVGVRLTSANYMLDFRFKVIDPEKAAPLLSRSAKPSLVDEASGYRFFVPVSGKVGALRQDTRKPTPNRIYYSFFANPGGFVKKGNKVTIVIGSFKAKHIVVE